MTSSRIRSGRGTAFTSSQGLRPAGRDTGLVGVLENRVRHLDVGGSVVHEQNHLLLFDVGHSVIPHAQVALPGDLVQLRQCSVEIELVDRGTEGVETLAVHPSGESFGDGLDGVGGIAVVGLDQRLEPRDRGGGRFGVEGAAGRRLRARPRRARSGWPAPAGAMPTPTPPAGPAPMRRPRGCRARPSRPPPAPSRCRCCRPRPSPCGQAVRPAPGLRCGGPRRSARPHRLVWPRTVRAGCGRDACCRRRASVRR